MGKLNCTRVMCHISYVVFNYDSFSRSIGYQATPQTNDEIRPN
jgi:hypothetical protein